MDNVYEIDELETALTACLSPEQRLAGAVLWTAVKDIHSEGAHLIGNDKTPSWKIRVEAREWMCSESREEGSFIWWCEASGVESEVILDRCLPGLQRIFVKDYPKARCQNFHLDYDQPFRYPHSHLVRPNFQKDFSTARIRGY